MSGGRISLRKEGTVSVVIGEVGLAGVGAVDCRDDGKFV